ncbi:MAG: glycoside hydrolase family 15 protein [Neorhizobium sp.]|nr:glycoside hydrolase family 15 protein [Neorhizobium sp.]
MPPAAPVVPRPIAEHGAIGNLRTLSLVARDGAIDFLCWPNFDSPSVFAALLDPEKGGAFELSPQIEGAREIQMYVPETNVLLTRWLGAENSAEVIDLMPIPEETGAKPSLVRRIAVTRGEVSFRLHCWPRFDYARRKPNVSIDGPIVHFSCGDFTLRLCGDLDFVEADGGVTAHVTLKAGEKLDLVLDDDGRDAEQKLPDKESLDLLIRQTLHYWQSWSKRSTYRGRWRSAVNRSALALKLLTSSEYGSIAAAGTFGLPEAPGGPRNWDYRATWIRDASFTVYALMRLGYQDEANAFTHWITERTDSARRGHMQIMYNLDGSNVEQEISLDHLSGYAGSRPVRVGNNAAEQVQLDIYGELLDSIYISNKYGEAISHANWRSVRRVVDHVCDVWQDKDAGIWEIRSEPQEHLHSRLMCWVAVDRALRLAQKRSLAAPFGRWIEVRNAITEDIWANFWNEDLGHFVHAKGGDDLDASMLMMPLVRFISATDPAWLKTLDAISAQLTDDSLVMRYRRKDGLKGDEGFFAACSFWYVECLARAGRLDDAEINMEKLLLLGNHLQLYAEEFDARGDFLGNFPQAFTHLALISAAFYLDGALDGKFSQWRP